jgi:hypothetical protein
LTSAFIDHCRAVAKDFLRTVIVIDDQAGFTGREITKPAIAQDEVSLPVKLDDFPIASTTVARETGNSGGRVLGAPKNSI